MRNLEGVFVVLTTPFTHGDVNYSGLRSNVAWLIEQGVHGIIPLGSTGEFASLNDDQRSHILHAVVEVADGQVPIVAGAGAETTEKTVRNIEEAAAAGASAVLVIPPWYYSPNPEEQLAHYTRIGETSSIPVMVYNNPFTSKVDIEPATLAKLAGVANIDYVKESSGNIRRIAEIRILTEDRLPIFCGWEDMAFESFVMGAVGWVCVIGNVMPKQAVRLFDLIRHENDLPAAWELYKKMLPLLQYLEYRGRTQQALKYMLDKMGLCGGESSSPKLPLNSKEMAELDRMMITSGITRAA